MIDTLSTPWDFHNNDKKVYSPDNFHNLVYYKLNEIAMGAPIAGECYLENKDKQKIRIHDWCGGPPAWEKGGQFVAIPIWTRKFLKGTVQQIGVVDTERRELRIFTRTFTVLDLRSFHKGVIYGYDSPIRKSTTLTFDTQKEKVDKVIELTK
jgi:hypothetical protein